MRRAVVGDDQEAERCRRQQRVETEIRAIADRAHERRPQRRAADAEMCTDEQRPCQSQLAHVATVKSRHDRSIVRLSPYDTSVCRDRISSDFIEGKHMKDVTGKVAFITGGASGMGLAMARSFSAAGMKVAIADIEQERARSRAGRVRQDERRSHHAEGRRDRPRCDGTSGAGDRSRVRQGARRLQQRRRCRGRSGSTR